MPLRVIPHKPTGGLTITGTVAGTRVRRRAQSNSPKLAAEEASTIEANLLRAAWHGERRGSRTFAEAVTAYLEAKPRSESTKTLCRKLLLALGTTRLADIDQGTVAWLRKQVLTPSASPARVSRGIIVPLRAVLRNAHKRGWCDAPVFDIPKRPEGRTLYLLPDEAERLITAAAPHLRPLLLFLLGTGARMSEAIELEWRDLDLRGARAIFWRTKGGKRRIAQLPPRIVATLAALPHREGPVFRWETTPSPSGKATRISTYADHGRESGGQIKRGWAGAIRARRARSSSDAA
jgi:integrase